MLSDRLRKVVRSTAARTVEDTLLFRDLVQSSGAPGRGAAG
jgi:hypothetical protein